MQTFSLNCQGKLLVIDKPVVMGIINATPDSFFAGSRHQAIDDALKAATQMLEEGAAILDIGGQSTRPGSRPLPANEEIARVVPLVAAIRLRFPDAVISIDTYHSETAKAAVEAGAAIVNDISGGSFDQQMLSTVAALRVPYVCMHLKGTPETMHQPAAYGDLVQDVLDYFIQKTEECRQQGIHDLIVDPGFGFSKNIGQNFDLLKRLECLSVLRKPVLLGISRKSTVYKTLGITAEQALNGTTVLHTAGLLKGAAILRVHDVREAVEAVELTRLLM
ncbi:MAG: dihydropteroate synthase [Chitinophagaceae bacterium]|nr:dihydropteroate synthase [Chitinophagaceae bacterium]